MCLSEFILNENLSENEWTWEIATDLDPARTQTRWKERGNIRVLILKPEWICTRITESERIWMWSESQSTRSPVNPSETAWIWLSRSQTGWICIRFDLSVSDTEAGEIRWVQTRLGDSDSERERSSSSEEAPSTQNTPSHCYDIVNDKVYYY